MKTKRDIMFLLVLGSVVVVGFVTGNEEWIKIQGGIK